MESIILEANNKPDVIFDVADLAAYLERLPDPRDKRGRVYELGSLLAMIVLARMAGEDKPTAIFEWIRFRQSAFVQLFKLKRHKTPCLNTIRTILSYSELLSNLQTTLRRYLHERYGGQSSMLIGIDSKVQRGTIPPGQNQGVHLLSAFVLEEGIVLDQVVVDKKTNETRAIPTLLAGLNLKHKVVCADAMHTQRTFCCDVLARGGNYVLYAKGNQETLLADIEQFFVAARRAAGWHIPQLSQTVATQTNKGHGRIERRTLTLIADNQQFLDWPGVKQVFKLQRDTTNMTTGEQTTSIVYGLTSCSPHEANAEQLLKWTRKYWAIENELHYRRDVTLKEDMTRTKIPKLAEAIAILNNFVIGLTSKLGYRNLAAARRYFEASIAMQLPR